MMRYLLAFTLATLFTVNTAQADQPLEADLVKRINQVIEKVRQRPLNSEDHTPWVIMHAVVPFEQNFTLLNRDTGKTVNAVDYLLTQAKFDGKRIYRDDNGIPRLPTRDITPGLRRSFLIQDHVDQYLYAYADAQVALSRQLVSEGGKVYSLQDKLEETRNGFHDRQEVGWTLVVLATYQAFDHQWQARNGKHYRTEDVMAIAIKRDPRRETEGGSHHLYGVAYCLERYLSQGGKLEGVWAEARDYLDKYLAQAKQWQQPSGELSAGVFRANRPSRSPRELVSITGHFLEWMSVAMTAEQLRQPWVVDALEALVSTMEEHPLNAFSDGGMYHAAHALIRIRDKAAPSH